MEIKYYFKCKRTPYRTENITTSVTSEYIHKTLAADHERYKCEVRAVIKAEGVDKNGCSYQSRATYHG